MWNVECGMWNVEWPFSTRIFSHRCHRSTDAMRAESPMTSIAQGKRSDALGKPKRHATPCKGKSTSNTLCFNAFTPAWRKLHGTLHPGYSCLVQRQSRAATGLRTSGPPSFHGCNMRRFPHSSSRPAQRLQP